MPNATDYKPIHLVSIKLDSSSCLQYRSQLDFKSRARPDEVEVEYTDQQ